MAVQGWRWIYNRIRDGRRNPRGVACNFRSDSRINIRLRISAERVHRQIKGLKLTPGADSDSDGVVSGDDYEVGVHLGLGVSEGLSGL